MFGEDDSVAVYGMFETTCFTHERTQSIGMCALCERSWCAECFAAEHQTGEDFMCQKCFEVALRFARRRIRTGWIVAAVGFGILLLGIGMLFVAPLRPGVIIPRVLLVGLIFFIGGAYLFWAFYWGLVSMRAYFRDVPFVFRGVLTLFTFPYYGPYGGGILTYVRHRRFVEGTKANAKLALKLNLRDPSWWNW